MGGTIGFTVREKDGKEHRMFRWTNLFPHFVNNVKFIDGDEQHLKEYLQTWYDMVKAYESGDTKEQPMADIYVPGAGLCPVEYGLIVVDYRTMTVLECQSYSSIGQVHPGGVGLAIMDNEDKINGLHVSDDDDWDFERYEALFSSGRINKAVRHADFEEVDASGLTMERFGAGMGMKSNGEFMAAYIDMSPWKVVKFDQNENGFKALKDAVHDLGFELSAEEEEGWNEFMESRLV